MDSANGFVHFFFKYYYFLFLGYFDLINSESGSGYVQRPVATFPRSQSILSVSKLLTRRINKWFENGFFVLFPFTCGFPNVSETRQREKKKYSKRRPNDLNRSDPSKTFGKSIGKKFSLKLLRALKIRERNSLKKTPNGNEIATAICMTSSWMHWHPNFDWLPSNDHHNRRNSN